MGGESITVLRLRLMRKLAMSDIVSEVLGDCTFYKNISHTLPGIHTFHRKDCSAVQCSALQCSALHCIALHCTALQSDEVPVMALLGRTENMV